MSQNIEFVNLKIEISESDLLVTYKFSGDVDENFDQQNVPRIKRPMIVFELGEVNNFNSCGIREWIYFVRSMSDLGSLKFKNCSVSVIDQINMVPDSLGNGEVESFYAPYFCKTHGESNQLINVKEHINSLKQKKAPSYKCDKCNEPLEFDALEESYFLFMDASALLQNAS